MAAVVMHRFSVLAAPSVRSQGTVLGGVFKCDKETLLQQRYTPDCMHKRNRYMVDQADYIIAVWNGKPSGTGKTVQYAQQQGKPVRVINPITLVVENI
jgi:uncharacterized phage-like protein YoqJ